MKRVVFSSRQNFSFINTFSCYNELNDSFIDEMIFNLVDNEILKVNDKSIISFFVEPKFLSNAIRKMK